MSLQATSGRYKDVPGVLWSCVAVVVVVMTRARTRTRARLSIQSFIKVVNQTVCWTLCFGGFGTPVHSRPGGFTPCPGRVGDEWAEVSRLGGWRCVKRREIMFSQPPVDGGGGGPGGGGYQNRPAARLQATCYKPLCSKQRYYLG